MTPSVVAVDTSVAIPLLVETHSEHAVVSQWSRGRVLSLSDHALVETYSVLTRLPGDLRVSGTDAVALLSARFIAPVMLDPQSRETLPEIFARLDISGGAVYDAMIGLAAAERGVPLATRDARARLTYERTGASVEIVS